MGRIRFRTDRTWSVLNKAWFALDKASSDTDQVRSVANRIIQARERAGNGPDFSLSASDNSFV